MVNASKNILQALQKAGNRFRSVAGLSGQGKTAGSQNLGSLCRGNALKAKSSGNAANKRRAFGYSASAFVVNMAGRGHGADADG